MNIDHDSPNDADVCLTINNKIKNAQWIKSRNCDIMAICDKKRQFSKFKVYALSQSWDIRRKCSVQNWRAQYGAAILEDLVILQHGGRPGELCKNLEFTLEI